jgi:two-component system CheB/CheR fusion protein
MPARKAPLSNLVVIGSSAGGIDALATLVGTLPKDFAAPIVLAQHLDPRRPSHLAEILGKASTIPLVAVSDTTSLEPGTIYVVPANRHVVVTDHEITLSGGDQPRPMPSIDRLFESAAKMYGEGLIAVILTGAGSDGAAGARHVKLAGGTVVIQNPETASFPAMPLSLAPTTVDVVADIEAIGPLLHELVRGEYRPTKPDEESLLTTFLHDVREISGIDFSHYKRPTILRRLQRRMVATGSSSLRDYVLHAQSHPDELQRLASSFLIKVTEFFRDRDLYRYLTDTMLPKLIDHAEANGGELRFWSAGCATGEEAYSLAIVAAQALEGHPNIKLRVFATDVDSDAIEFARRGLYPASAVANVPSNLRERYFTEAGGHFEVIPAVRALIAFGQHDLAMRAPFPRIDLAVCRNVLIYFTQDLQRRALQLFAFSLRDGGYLALGKAETTSPLSELFVLEEPRLKVFRRHGVRVVLPPQGGESSIPGLPPRASGPSNLRLASDMRTSRLPGDLERARVQAARADALVLRLPVGLVIVDRKYDIASINSAGRSMLGVHGAAVGQDLIHLATGVSSNELRRGIDAAFRGEPWRATWDIPMRETTTPDVQSLELTAYRQTEDGGNDLVVLLVRDVSSERAQTRRLEDELAAAGRRAASLQEQLERIGSLARTLREANEELTTVNAELRSQNDELVVANEEVQAATEEVETLNEEMQATNEELETLNEEMQATVEELNTTNDDLEARSAELQTLALSLEKQRKVSEDERARLQAILASMADAVIVVGGNGEVVLTNDAYEEQFGDSDGADLEDADSKPIRGEDRPRTRAARGEHFTMNFTRGVADGQRTWYEAHGRPLASGGGVVVIRDITDRSLQKIQHEFVMTLSHELRTPLTGLTAYLEMLLRRMQNTSDQKQIRYLERAVSQAHRFNALVTELFDASRMSSGRMTYEFETLELRPIVEEAVTLAGSIDEQREVTLDGGRARLVVRADPHRLQQVVFNLVSNALRHAPDSERIAVRLRKRNGQAELAVQDWGPGIPPERQGELFHRADAPGEAASSDGLGLGLYLTHGIVEAHDGTIDVDSTQGQGTIITVRLPLARG